MRYGLIFVAAALAAAGCDKPSQPAGGGSGAPPVTLTIGHVGHDHHLALYVAALEGRRFLRDYGLGLKEVKARAVYDLIDANETVARLRLVKVGGGSRMPAAMSRGEIEIGLGGTLPVAKFADAGQPFKIICPLQADGDMLVMRTDSPARDWATFVAAAKASDKPLRIGYKAPVAVAKLIFERALTAEGIPYGFDQGGKVRIVLVNFGSEKSPIPLMESGSIDGFVMNQPAVAVAVDKGLGKAVCELRDLPPAGTWHDHPCCCVAATTETLAQHPRAIKTLLKVILLSTQLIRADEKLAIRSASRWTKYSEKVEAASIPTITYVAEPTDAWLAGMRTWAKMMREIKLFKGKYAKATGEAFVADVCDLRLCRAAATELRQKGLLK